MVYDQIAPGGGQGGDGVMEAGQQPVEHGLPKRGAGFSNFLRPRRHDREAVHGDMQVRRVSMMCCNALAMDVLPRWKCR